MPGRSDNCVKNHFYSKLRKAVRRLNRAAGGEQGRRGPREIRLETLYKLIEITEERFRSNSKVDDELIETCLGRD